MTGELGAMPMPPDFRYREVYLRGKPRHAPFDAFDLRHPRMDPGKRAKIFGAFDALKGFDDRIRETARRAARETAPAEDVWPPEAGAWTRGGEGA